MKKIKNIIAISAFSLMVLALPSIASAQWNGGGYPNSGGIFRGGRDLDRVAERLKDNARDLERQIDREFQRRQRRLPAQLRRCNLIGGYPVADVGSLGAFGVHSGKP